MTIPARREDTSELDAKQLAEREIARLLGERTETQAGDSIMFRSPNRFIFKDADLEKVDKQDLLDKLHLEIITFRDPNENNEDSD